LITQGISTNLAAMDGQGHRRGSSPEPRGFISRTGSGEGDLRRAWDWLFGDRADIDQEGLLAGRTLLVRRTRREDADEASG
jgi:hypothetical protein